MGFWWRPLGVLTAVLFIAAMVWAGSDKESALIFLVAVQAVMMLRRLWQEFRLARWLENPELVRPPDGTGTWGDIFYRLDKLQRSQKASRNQLANALDQFEHAAMAVPDGMIILNQTEQIEWCNPASRRFLGLDCERDRGQYVRYLLRQAHFQAFFDANDYAQRLTCKSPLDSSITISLQMVPFSKTKKLLIARDITDLERVDAMRRDFIANVSHELRTPLTVVGGFVETLAENPKLPEADTRRYFNLMMEHTRRMQRLLDDLLTLSRLEGNYTLEDEQVNVPNLLQTLESEAESLSHGRHGITLALQSQAFLTGSLQEIHSAFGNLVSNAVRYTPEGGSIALSWSERDGEVVFAVRDSGMGIAPEHIPRLTERFYRVDQSRSRETGGTGLGLAIVKHVLTRHGARLEVQSVPGRGSTFSAIFPASRMIQPDNHDNVIKFARAHTAA